MLVGPWPGWRDPPRAVLPQAAQRGQRVSLRAALSAPAHGRDRQLLSRAGPGIGWQGELGADPVCAAAASDPEQVACLHCLLPSLPLDCPSLNCDLPPCEFAPCNPCMAAGPVA